MSRYVEILANQRPFSYGVDENGRTLFSVNFSLLAAAPVAKFEREMVKLLSDAGFATLGTDTFIGPASPVPTGVGPYITIIDTGGMSPAETHDNKDYERLSLQVITRGANYETTSTRALNIWRTLDGKRNVTVTVP